MTGGSRQSARSRVAEAEKQARIARESLPERHSELAERLGDVTADLKDIGEAIETDGRQRSDGTHAG